MSRAKPSPEGRRLLDEVGKIFEENRRLKSIRVDEEIRSSLKAENTRLREENARLRAQRDAVDIFFVQCFVQWTASAKSQKKKFDNLRLRFEGVRKE